MTGALQQQQQQQQLPKETPKEGLDVRGKQTVVQADVREGYFFTTHTENARLILVSYI